MTHHATPLTSTTEVPPTPPIPDVRFGLGAKVGLLAVACVAGATFILAFVSYRWQMAAYLRGVDAKLLAVATALPEMIGDQYEGRAAAGNVSSDEYNTLTRRLSEFAQSTGVYYLYSYIERDGRLLSTATSASPEELRDGSWTPYLEAYKEPPPEIAAALSNGRITYASYTDEYGSFRSAFLPIIKGEQPYVVGADIRMDEILSATRAALVRMLLLGLVVAAGFGLLGVSLGNRIARPIRSLTEHVRTFADDDFGNDDEAEAAIARIAARESNETGKLARTMLVMQQHLRQHIERVVRLSAERQNILSQLQIAREVQESLLPRVPPELPGFEVFGWSRPAEHAGGDFYDWFITPAGRLIVTIADVAGHGVGPAIMAAVCRAYARATLRDDEDLGTVIGRINRLLAGDVGDSRFVTYFACVLDPSTRDLVALSAGHGPVLLYRAGGDIETAEVHGVPLGIVDDFVFDPGSRIALRSGDVLLMCSDGFWEYFNPEDEQYGEKRLKAALAAAHDLPAEKIIEHIREDVAAFARGAPQGDDMTAVVIRVL